MRRLRAYTLIEVLVIILAIALLAGALIPALSVNRRKKERVDCVNHLKQIGLAFKVFPSDSDDRFPYSHWNCIAYTNDTLAWLHFQALSNELQMPAVLVCPGDFGNKKAAGNFNLGAKADGSSLVGRGNAAVSYFVNLEAEETKPQAILAGDRNIAPNQKLAPYSTKAAGRAAVIPIGAEWSTLSPDNLHGGQGNLLLGDGSVQQASNQILKRQMQLSTNSYGTNVNRFLFPQ